MKYNQFEILLTMDGKKFAWTIKMLDGTILEESAETFHSREQAIEDAKQFIDQWWEDYKKN